VCALFTLVILVTRLSLHRGTVGYRWTAIENQILFLNGFQKAFSILGTHAWYMQLFLWPDGLAFDHGVGSFDPNVLAAYGAVAGLLLYTAVGLGIVFLARERLYSPLLALAGVLVSFLPASHIVMAIGTVVAERLAYLPSVFLCILVAWVLRKASQSTCFRTKEVKFARWAMPGIVVAVAVGLAFVSHQYEQAWTDEISLFGYGLRTHPTNFKALVNLGVLQRNSRPDTREMIQQAIGMFEHTSGIMNAALQEPDANARQVMLNK